MVETTTEAPRAVPHIVRDLMTRAPLFIDPGDRLDLAEAAMARARCRHLPVVRDGGLVGILSLRDLLRASPGRRHRRGPTIHDVRVEQVMTAPPILTHPNEDVFAAARRLHRAHVSCLPVVDGRLLVGIVTMSDFVGMVVWMLRREEAALGRPLAITELMTPAPLQTARASDHLDLAEVLMSGERCHHLPVLDGERLVGLVSDRDLLAAFDSELEALNDADRQLDKAALIIAEVMTRDPLTITPQTPAALAGLLLMNNKLSALPVMHGDRLVGIVTESDYLSYAIARQP